jgi:hypothetical protein
LKTEILIKATFLKAFFWWLESLYNIIKSFDDHRFLHQFSAKILRKQTGAPGNRRGVSEKQNWVF